MPPFNPRVPRGTSTSKNVSSSYNKSGIGLTGPTGSGTASYKDIPSKTGSVRIRPGSAVSRITEAGSSGGTVKSQWVGSGDKRRYVTVAEAHKDRGSSVPPANTARGNAAAGVDAGKSRGAPSRVKPDVSAGGKADKIPAVEGSLNYYMKKTMADGRGNARNRAYALWKRDKAARLRGGR